MSEPVKICIVLEGGLVQSIMTAGVAAEVVVIDYDTDGADDDELTVVPQADGSSEEALVTLWTAEGGETDRAFAVNAFTLAEHGALLRNHYVCPDCETTWQDDWSCACDDDCPSCGTNCSPSETEELHA